MSLTYILLLIFPNSGYAAPIYPSRTPREAPSSPTTDNLWSAVLSSIIPELQPQRTHSNIVWSCIFTAVLCSWISIHPNVPPQSRRRRLFRGVRTMFWTIVAPELILGWAVRQWFAAKEIRDLYNKHRPYDQSWTMTHGHFLDMGGFILVDPPNEQLGPFNQVLTLERFQELVHDPGFVFPVLTAADIKDRSKGDGLLKVIAIVQTGWFTIQCIARCVQRLALTELELLTLTLASLNALTLLCWWSKPSGVKEPTRIYLAVQPTAEGPCPDRDNWDYEFNVSVTAADIISKSVAALKEGVVYIAHFFRSPFKQHSWLTTLGSFSIIPFLLFFMITFPIYLLLSLGILALLRMVKTKKVQKPQDDDPIATRAVLNLVRFRYSLTFRIRRYFGMWLEIVFPSHSIARIFAWPFLPLFFFVLLMLLVVLSPFFAISFMASFIFTAVFGIVTTNNVRRNSICVPCFYAARTRSDRYSRMTVFVLFGTIFGSIQCIAWYFTYPTDSERTLWRVTALTLTVIPFVAAPIDWTLENRRQRIIRFFQVALELFLTIVLVIYVFARISLIAQAYALLRKQPPDAFVAVDWTKYIPHII